MDKPNLEDTVRSHLVACRGSWHDIARQASVSHSWISKFVNGRIPNPGYRTLTRLLDHLNGASDAHA